MKNYTALFSFLGIFSLVTLVFILVVRIFEFNARSNPVSNSKKLQVTTSLYPLYYFASQIGGDKAEVTNITPAGSEPHDYDPTPQDIARIEHGNMLILNSGVESWGNKIKDTLKDTKVTIVIAGEGITQTDPHVWLDPSLAKKEAHVITKGYTGIDPDNTAYYENNEKTLDGKLDDLDVAYQQGLKKCEKKDIITSHFAFGHLATRYGLQQVPIAGLSPDTEPSAQQMAGIARFAREHGVKYIFFESLVSPKLSETIANEVGAKTMVLDPIEGISDDDRKQEKNYFTIMKDNLKNLQTALQCNK